MSVQQIGIVIYKIRADNLILFSCILFNLKVQNNGFTLKGNTRIYFATRGDIGDPYIYWQTPVLGNRFSYEIDVSNVGCHCDASAYFVNLPGHNAAQQLEPGPG